MLNDEQIAQLLKNTRTIAVVGLSDKPWRPSYGVSAYMQRCGYHIIPVNPEIEESLGEKSLRSLDEIEDPIEIVNVFRDSEYIAELIEPAMNSGAQAIWMQEGVWDEKAARRAEQAGLGVVMNRCILKEHQRLIF